ncbi:MAG TPA: anthranilate phosphoribosyltransferase [Aeromicrobium sp.]|nr:anthranilate phosphoribosyltransferase [Aeromicrobium sp.]
MTDLSWPGILSTLLRGENLPDEAATWAMEQILGGHATPSQIGGFLIALRAKGETVEEITAFVETMYRHAAPLQIDRRVVDIVGTGGDGARTVNISTMAAVTIAGAAVPVVKHGNRASSSESGSADVLEALGVRLDVPVADLAGVLDAVGITFCFAPAFHPSMRFAGPTRKELGIPTTFNFLGPLANPARPGAMAVGVSDLRMGELMAGVLAGRGIDALVFRGDDGLDELTTATTSTVWEVSGGAVRPTSLDPQELGISASEPGALTGGDAEFNADVFRRVIAGEPGPVREAVLLNAAAGIAAFDAASDSAAGSVNDRLAAALTKARTSIDSGSAARVLESWIAHTAEAI